MGVIEIQNPIDLIKGVYDLLDEKKSENLKLFNLVKVNPYFNYIIIATATSPVHLKSLVREIQKNYGSQLPEKTSGFRPEDMDSGWVIVDFIDVIVHIFLKDERAYYNLEKLWRDADEIFRKDRIFSNIVSDEKKSVHGNNSDIIYEDDLPEIDQKKENNSVKKAAKKKPAAKKKAAKKKPAAKKKAAKKAAKKKPAAKKKAAKK